MKNIAILGSTGSIGTQTIEVVRQYSEDFRIVALSCNSNIDLLEKQVREFKPLLCAVYDEDKAKEILSQDEVIIDVNVNEGDNWATCWGCDLTYDYVKINGDYRT
jgi:1-deoxy-D-xylulose 5-phosphate reductoisomerase